MASLSLKNWQDCKEELAAAGVKLPAYDAGAVKAAGMEQPVWMHFGGGNLYRAFHAQIANELANKGLLDRGVVVAETFRPFTLDEVYAPYNYDILQVVMNADGTLDENLIAVTAGGCFANSQRPEDLARAKRYFESSELQLVTFTITEKGYSLRDAAGELMGYVKAELEAGPDAAASSMGIVASLLLARFNAGAAPIAMVSTDNFSQNGARFREAILTVARGWQDNGHVGQDFVDYVSDESRVSFPWSMIDRITPNPSPETEAALKEQGWSDLDLIRTSGPTFAGFANTEACHYLVIEDSFPNGRPALDAGGVILCDRQTAERADTMKVTACLNPLHTCLAVFGCLLGYDRIWKEMENADLASLVHHLGYDEDLPVVVDPEVIDPQSFIDELTGERLVNKSLPDAPQRIATDTSQKVAIRYGHTLNAYLADGKDVSGLTYIPLTIAGWLRYLMGVGDDGKPFECSPDPLLSELQAHVSGLELGSVDAEAIHAAAEPILSNTEIFTLDLYSVGLGEKIEGFLGEMLDGTGAVAATIHKYL
ncbi:mannitol dehydrogenase family protein [Paratractidigestivibacter sp.]|uniref:mannitol dehydrogenase family protein n=1 Tax=Paratractidigestivibacter sp. TaxID=2847316 RepID=UPI002ABD8B89|nr:mannitol dehydrogenase family protein [Paratractidigestivibacter sp.]